MTQQELGTKRTCSDCEVKFYDLNRSPAVCPKCGYTFTQKKASAPAAKPVKQEEKPAEPVAAASPSEDGDDVATDKDVPDEADLLAQSVEDDDEDELDAPADKDVFIDSDDEDDNVTDLVEGVGDKIEEN